MDFNILFGPQSKWFLNWCKTSIFNPQNLCSVIIVCFAGPFCCMLFCFIMSTWNLSFLYDRPDNSKTQRRSISMFLSLYIKISGFCTISVHYCAISFPFQKLWLNNLTSLISQLKHVFKCVFFFFFFNSSPVFRTILSLLLPIFNFLPQFQVYFLTQRAKNIQWCLQIKPFFFFFEGLIVYWSLPLICFFCHFKIVLLILQILLVSNN